MLKIFSVIFFTSLLSLQSFAGFERGNGGNIVLCLGESQPLFLDYYLFKRSQTGIYLPPLSPMDQGPMEKALNLILPIYQYDRGLALSFAETINNFPQEAFYISDMPRVVVDDEGLPASAETFNCQMHQLIFQREQPLFDGIRYFVSLPHWRLLSDDQKATALVHEALLREYITLDGFYSKQPIQNVVKGLLSYALFQDKKALVAVHTELDQLKSLMKWPSVQASPIGR